MATDSMKALDNHTLNELRNFWKGELKALEGVAAIPGKAPQALPQDLALVQSKLERLNTEIRRRADDNV